MLEPMSVDENAGALLQRSMVSGSVQWRHALGQRSGLLVVPPYVEGLLLQFVLQADPHSLTLKICMDPTGRQRSLAPVS